jgi:hypothetical protein
MPVWKYDEPPVGEEAVSKISRESEVDLVGRVIEEKFGEAGQLAASIAKGLEGFKQLAQIFGSATPQAAVAAAPLKSDVEVAVEGLSKVFNLFGTVQEAAKKFVPTETSPGPGWPTFKGEIPAYFHPYVVNYVDQTIKGWMDYATEKAKGIVSPRTVEAPKAPTITPLSTEKYKVKAEAS